MVNKIIKLLSALLIGICLFACDDEPMYPIKTYEATIFRLKAENDSLREQLEKCDDWVNFLESEDKKSKEE